MLKRLTYKKNLFPRKKISNDEGTNLQEQGAHKDKKPTKERNPQRKGTHKDKEPTKERNPQGQGTHAIWFNSLDEESKYNYLCFKVHP